MFKIELSTVVFYQGELPRKLSLRDCSLPLAQPAPDAFFGIYGTRSKPEAFMAARFHAQANQLQYAVVDVVVELESQRLQTVMQPGEIQNHDFFSLLRMASAMSDDVRGWILAGLPAFDRRAEALEQLPIVQALARDPSLLGLLVNSPACRHLRVIASPVATQFSERPLNAGLVPHRHWSSIKEATCRFDPTVHVTLEPPVRRKLAKPDASASPTKTRATKPR